MQVISKVVRAILGVILLSTMATGVEFFGNCHKFGSSEIQPNIPNSEWYCLERDVFKYCRFYTCAWTNCETPLTSSKGKCQYCPGTCSYGGSLFKVGETVPCLDRSNRCRCFSDDRIFSTRVAQNPRSMCGL